MRYFICYPVYGQNASYHRLLIISALIRCYTYAWDIKIDWVLFEGGYFTRRERIYPYKVSYILVMIGYLLLRWVWTLTISVGEGGLGVLNYNIFKTVLFWR